MSIPFRAEYNDYGSIQNINPEDQVLVDLAMAQLSQYAVEMPQGENPYHDPGVNPKAITPEMAWNALWENRLFVRQQKYSQTPPAFKVPKGIPTWKRVLKITAKCEKKGDLIPGTIATRIAYGLVSVSYHGEYTKKGDWYKAIRPILEAKYRVTERYEYGLERHKEDLEKSPDKDYGDVWFEVAPKDVPEGSLPENPHRIARDKRLLSSLVTSNRVYVDKTLPVTWAFIREDVWQAILPLGGPNYTGWGPGPTVEKTLGQVNTTFKPYIERSRALKTPPVTETEEDKNLRILVEKYERYALESLLEGTLPYSKSTPPFVSGMSDQFKDFCAKLAHKEVPFEATQVVAKAFAEYTVVRSILSTVCIEPKPTHCGPQDGAWKAHKVYHKALSPVINEAAKAHKY